MTREEAKELLIHILMTYEPKDQYGDYDDPEPYEQAITMAIEALSAEDVVPYEDYRKLLYSRHPDELVRCKDCRHGQYDATHYFCAEHYHKVYEDDYCSHGERRCNYFGERREP